MVGGRAPARPERMAIRNAIAESLAEPSSWTACVVLSSGPGNLVIRQSFQNGTIRALIPVTLLYQVGKRRAQPLQFTYAQINLRHMPLGDTPDIGGRTVPVTPQDQKLLDIRNREAQGPCTADEAQCLYVTIRIGSVSIRLSAGRLDQADRFVIPNRLCRHSRQFCNGTDSHGGPPHDVAPFPTGVMLAIDRRCLYPVHLGDWIRHMLLLIDNYDSFTWNLVHYLGELGAEVVVRRNDALSVNEALGMGPSAVVLSPGPCDPDKAGICLGLIEAAARERLPLLGVCLGHQAIGQAFGGNVVRAPEPMHGKVSNILHRGEALMHGLPSPFRATRYHSLIVDRDSLPVEIAVTAETEDGIIMALAHRSLPIHGVQFHPESIASEHGHRILGNFLDIASRHELGRRTPGAAA